MTALLAVQIFTFIYVARLGYIRRLAIKIYFLDSQGSHYVQFIFNQWHEGWISKFLLVPYILPTYVFPVHVGAPTTFLWGSKAVYRNGRQMRLAFKIQSMDSFVACTTQNAKVKQKVNFWQCSTTTLHNILKHTMTPESSHLPVVYCNMACKKAGQ